MGTPQSFPTLGTNPLSGIPAPLAQPSQWVLFLNGPSVAASPLDTCLPSRDPDSHLLSTTGYVGAATVGAAAWWFLYADDGPHVTYSQLVGRIEEGGGWGAGGRRGGFCGIPAPVSCPCRLTSCSATRKTLTSRAWTVRSLRPPSP